MAKLRQSTNKDITDEQDEFRSLAERTWQRVSDDPRRAAAVAGGVAAAILAVLLVFHLVERAAEKRIAAAGAVAARYVEGEADRTADPALREEMERLSEKYSRSREGGQVLYYLAGLRAAEGDYGAAEEAYRKVRDRYGPGDTLHVAASMGLAYTYKLMGESGKALEVFEETLGVHGAPVARTLVELEIGRLYEGQGEREKAVEIYRRLAEKDPEGNVGNRARQRLALLGNG